MVKGVNSSMIYSIYFKFCKCHNVPPPSTTIKLKKKKTRIKATKSWFFEMDNKINKPLANLTKMRREKCELIKLEMKK
jgi:hypothetical protein